MTTIAEQILTRADDDRPALLLEDDSWSYRDLAREAAARAALLTDRQHVGVLLDNVPEFVFWLSAAAIARAVVVGINPTRRGAELEADIRATDCALIVTDGEHLPLLDGLDHGARVLTAHRYDGAALPDVTAEPQDLYVLFFTSGTTGRPKAVRCSQGRMAIAGLYLSAGFGLADGVVYQCMPMFHSNALMAGWAPALCAGAPMAMRPRFSASAWLDDVRRYGATYFNYVGKPLAYILATPEREDDADNPLRVGFGNEANAKDIDAFSRRFGCTIVDAYGSSEGGANIARTPETPPNALGPLTDDVRVLDPSTGDDSPPARFDGAGRLLNADEAIGEIATRSGPAMFEGYYNNPDADRERVHDGWYWTGDLAYRDEAGFLYFAGRGHDWLRVDGENFAAAPVEAIVSRHPDVMLAAVYAVPDPRVGDQVMACVQLRPDATFDPSGFDAFLRAQPDLHAKAMPRFVRVGEVPVTQTSKILKRELRAEAWECSDPVWWRRDRNASLENMTPAAREELREAFDRHGRTKVL